MGSTRSPRLDLPSPMQGPALQAEMEPQNLATCLLDCWPCWPPNTLQTNQAWEAITSVGYRHGEVMKRNSQLSAWYRRKNHAAKLQKALQGKTSCWSCNTLLNTNRWTSISGFQHMVRQCAVFFRTQMLSEIVLVNLLSMRGTDICCKTLESTSGSCHGKMK